MEIVVGAQLTPKVRLLRQIAEGGMGALWVGEHSGLGCEVAVKFLLGEFQNDEALRSRFAQEAAAASRVKSSHVVKVYDFGITESGVPYLVMELLDGIDLRKLLTDRGRLAISEALPIITQLCRALERAHDAHVVHRDIKPENIFLTTEAGDWFVKLLDFGVAKTERTLERSNAKSTLANETLGTPYYMSPEQFRSAKESGATSDIWAVGVVAYEMLTGSLPFEAETVGGLAIVVNDGRPKPPSEVNADLPPSFDAWFARACAHEPAARFASARELVDALRSAFPDQANASGPIRQVVLSIPDGALAGSNPEELSLRETAFATTRTQRASGWRWPLWVVGAVAIGGVAFFATRENRQQAQSSAPSAPATPEPIALPTATPTHAPIEPITPSAAASIAVPIPPRATPRASASGASATPTTSARKKDDLDIY